MSDTRLFIDQTGREVIVPAHPRRIVSLVPSQTELLADLGLQDEVAGITKFCVHPESWFRSKTRIGGTKQLHLDKIRELQPDLIIANKEENERVQVEELANEFPVWISDIQTLPQALQMIQVVGQLVNRYNAASQLVDEIVQGFNQLTKAQIARKVAYFIWYKPWMTVGNDTFIHHMIRTIGWENVYADTMRYPETDMQELARRNPELVLLSSEPYPFKEKHIAEIKEALPNVEVKLVDGEMFSWYGSRMLKAIPYMQGLLRE